MPIAMSLSLVVPLLNDLSISTASSCAGCWSKSLPVERSRDIFNLYPDTFFTFDIRSSPISSLVSCTFDEGFGTKSTAPISRALNVASAPYWVRTLIMTTGFGLVLTISLSAASPSMMGISISMVITSGLSCWFLITADLPLLAVPTTSIIGSLSRISPITFLKRAESSTIRTLIFLDMRPQFINNRFQ